MGDLTESMSIPVSSEGNGLHAAKKNPPSVMSNQLREELIRILKTGDSKHDGAFTVAVATQVEKFAVAAREILMTESLAQQDLASLMMMRKRQLGMGGPYLGNAGWGAIIGSEGVGDGLGMPYPIVNNENFGVQAVRQIVDAAKSMGDSPAKLVEALVIARSNNLADVASAIEKKLGVSKAESAPEGVALEGTAS